MKKNFYIPKRFKTVYRNVILSTNIYQLDKNKLNRLGIGLSMYSIEDIKTQKQYYILLICQKPLFMLIFNIFKEIKKITNTYLIYTDSDIFEGNKKNLILNISEFNIDPDPDNNEVLIYTKKEGINKQKFDQEVEKILNDKIELIEKKQKKTKK